jgi:GR25 family glycosyltransferase involved in LPS biosynthesis
MRTNANRTNTNKKEKSVLHKRKNTPIDRGIVVSSSLGIPFVDDIIHKTYVISMDAKRYAGLQNRVREWSSKLTHWAATNGNHIDKRQWATEKKCLHNSTMTRGELGVYDSHRRIWKDMTDSNIPIALVMEDDADLRYSAQSSQVIRDSIKQVQDLEIKFDILYLGHNNNYEVQMVTQSIAIPSHCQGLFTYVITLAGAMKLLRLTSPPYVKPIDVLLGDLSDDGSIVALSVEPRLGYVVPVISSTVTIK